MGLPQDRLTSSRQKKTRAPAAEAPPSAPQEEPHQEDQFRPEELSQTVRSHEIARRKASKQKIISDSQSPSEEDDPSQQLLRQILRELKTLNRRESFSEFSVAKLMAGLVQMLVFLCLIMSLWFIIGREPNPDKAQVALLLAVVFQTLTLTLMMMRR